MTIFIDPSSASSNQPLICLFNIANIMDKYDGNHTALDQILEECVKLLPHSLRQPEIAGARVLFPPFKYETEGFSPTQWSIMKEIKVLDEHVGLLEVSYSQEVDNAFSGPFTSDEVMLISYVAHRISRVIERLRIRKQLKLERQALQDSNTALSEVLKRIQSEQGELAKSVQASISKVVVPMLNSLISSSGKSQQILLRAAITNLQNIASPFTAKLSNTFMSLSPQEMQICSLIRQGLSSKDIASAKGISVATVNNHRQSIRSKLRLSNSHVNLKSFLNNNIE